MRGIQNPGNLCYLTSALQCLLFVPQLTNYFLGDLHEADRVKKRVNLGAFLAEYAALVKATWTSDGRVMGAQTLWAPLAKLHKTFANRIMQHDAHEALLAVVQALHDALGNTVRLHDAPSLRCVDRPAWDAHITESGYSILTELFKGQLRRTVRWDGGESTGYEHFWDLSVSINDASSITRAIACHMQPDVVHDYVPDGGGPPTTATVEKCILHAPLVLVVGMKRFDNRRNKIDKFVDYATEMELPGTAPGTTARYHLIAVCLHSGDAGGGHYTAMCTSHGHWFHLDDATVTEINDLNTIIQKDAYVLVYCRGGC